MRCRRFLQIRLPDPVSGVVNHPMKDADDFIHRDTCSDTMLNPQPMNERHGLNGVNPGHGRVAASLAQVVNEIGAKSPRKRRAESLHFNLMCRRTPHMRPHICSTWTHDFVIEAHVGREFHPFDRVGDTSPASRKLVSHAPNQMDERGVDKVAFVLEVMMHKAQRYTCVVADFPYGEILKPEFAYNCQGGVKQSDPHTVRLKLLPSGVRCRDFWRRHSH